MKKIKLFLTLISFLTSTAGFCGGGNTGGFMKMSLTASQNYSETTFENTQFENYEIYLEMKSFIEENKRDLIDFGYSPESLEKMLQNIQL